jgi:hypothetical protein
MLSLHSIGLKIEPLSASTIEIICGQNSNSVLYLASIPNPSIVNKRADYIKSIHEEVWKRIEDGNLRYKKTVDQHCRKVIFKVRDKVCIVLTKERFPIGVYSKLRD